VPDLNSSSFFAVFRRFIVRHGTPKIVYSDNAPTFTLTNKTIELNFPKLSKNSFWTRNFHLFPFPNPFPGIVAHSPWAGGHYERLIALIKFHFKRSLSSLYFPSIHPFDYLHTLVNRKYSKFMSNNI
jgi:hypothetical protein